MTQNTMQMYSYDILPKRLLSRNKIIPFHAQPSTKELKEKTKKKYAKTTVMMQLIAQLDLTNILLLAGELYDA